MGRAGKAHASLRLARGIALTAENSTCMPCCMLKLLARTRDSDDCTHCNAQAHYRIIMLPNTQSKELIRPAPVSYVMATTTCAPRR
jgi:hypothetical protein